MIRVVSPAWEEVAAQKMQSKSNQLVRVSQTNNNQMKTYLATILIIGLSAGSLIVHAQNSSAVNGGNAVDEGITATEPEEVLPLVQFEDAPLVDVIKTLARQASLNIVFDPQVVALGPDGRSPYPPVSIRLENVTAQAVLEAVLNNNNLRLERDPRTRISRVTVRDPAAAEPLVLKIYQLKYSNPSNMVAILRPTITARSQVIPDARTSQLIVLATEKELVEVDNLIDRLDTITKQVLIEARILETFRNPSTIKGVNWAGTFQAQNVVLGNNAFGSSTAGGGGSSAGGAGGGSESLNPPLTSGGTPSLMGFLRSGYQHPVAHLNADGARAVFSFFNQDSESEVIATPRAVTTDNSPATLQVTRAVPIYRVTQGGTQTGPTVDITYTNLGTILEVTPRISADNNIFLSVIPEVSDVESRDTQVIFGETVTANIFKVRRVTTQVLIPSGNTLVLGGLMSDNTAQQRTKVPLLGDLPGMKYVFGSRSKVRDKSNLLIFVTPTIVEDEDYQPTASDFLRQPVPADVPFEDMGSFGRPWDGTEPYDWAAPVY
jgi:type II secretory pathway component GspD/PulD (secretin)